MKIIRSIRSKILVSRLGQKHLVYVVVCGTFFAILAIAYQLSEQYRREIGEIEEVFSLVENSYLAPVSSSLFSLNKHQLQLLVESIYLLPYIEYVAVYEQTRDERLLVAYRGESAVTDSVIRSFPLVYRLNDIRRELGNLYVVASRERIKHSLQQHFVDIVISNTIMMAIFSFFILGIVYLLTIRHLERISSFVSSLRLNSTEDRHLSLSRNAPIMHQTDELDDIAGAINDMHSRMQKTYTQLTRTQDHLRALLSQKEALIRELYHRTNNNMHLIRSVLQLQAIHMPQNPAVQKLVADMDGRILAISLVHQRLYASRDLSRIGMKEYVHDLIDHIVHRSLPGEEAGRIETIYQIEDISLLLDIAIPCGLIINELVVNAIQHAFPDQRHGSITVGLRKENDHAICLLISDNGIGVSPEFDFFRTKTFGLQMVIATARHQLRGTIRFYVEHGVHCIVVFPQDTYTERV